MVALIVAGAMPIGSLALADALDPTMPRKIVVGAPKGEAPSDRLDGARRGRTSARLPFPAVERWRKHVSGGLEMAPVVDEAGNIYVASVAGEAIKLAPDNTELWHTKLGTSPASTSPVLTSDGTLVVISSAGQAVGVTPSGAIRYSTAIGAHKSDDTTPLALRDGGVVAAAGHTLVEIDADGEVRARATVDERPTGALVEGPEGTIVTGELGTVYSWRPPQAPRKLGSLGGSTKHAGATLGDQRTLFAVVDSRRVVALDLKTGTLHIRSGSASTSSFFDGPVAMAKDGVVLAATESGVLLGLDALGNEKVHVAIDKPPPSLDGGILLLTSSFFAASGEIRYSPPVLVDGQGRVAFIRNGGRLGVVSPEGNVAVATEHLCSSPIAILPAGDKKLLAACRTDGNLWMYGE